MSTARIPDGTPLGLVQVGLASNEIKSTSARWAYCRKDMNLMHVIGHCPYDPPEGRSDPPVKPTSEVAHQPGQQPAAATSHRESAQSRDVRVCATDPRPAPGADLTGALLSHPPERTARGGQAHWRDLGHRCGQGSAEECSTERSRAPDRQPVAPVEGRAWETPADRTV